MSQITAKFTEGAQSTLISTSPTRTTCSTGRKGHAFSWIVPRIVRKPCRGLNQQQIDPSLTCSRRLPRIGLVVFCNNNAVLVTDDQSRVLKFSSKAI
jgi:hypothetical protein